MISFMTVIPKLYSCTAPSLHFCTFSLTKVVFYYPTTNSVLLLSPIK